MTKLARNKLSAGVTRFLSTIAWASLLWLPVTANARIDGIPGPTFALSAQAGYISIADGGSVYSWGYSANGTPMQLPGPTLIVTAGDTVTVSLTNDLPTAAGNVSIIFPGHQMIPAPSGVAGDLTREAPTGGSVTYSFIAGEPGTYQYHSGTQPDLQVEMGLYGALIVRPATAPVCIGAGYLDALNTGAAYNHAGTCFDREYLFILSEVDMDIHQAAELQSGGPGPIQLPTGAYHSEYWLINGRAAPDTMAAAGTALLPSQPYNTMPRMHPGEKLLLRIVGAGREMHPFHTHGNHARLLARDGQMLVNSQGNLSGPLLFTIPSIPGGTADAIFEWTGQELGWDIYGHGPADPTEPNEWLPDHGRPIPVTLPSLNALAFGGFYSGSPFLGALGSLPPGEGGLNPAAGFSYMWHSHNEREMVNNDIFPGGMMTMLIVEAPSVEIME